MTQTKIIELLRRELIKLNWDILYYDFPNASRSGVKNFGKIALLFEHTYDLSPDLVAIKNNILLIFEVDHDIHKVYEKKRRYQKKQPTLILKFNSQFGRNIDRVKYGFGYIRNNPNRSDMEQNFDYIFLLKDNSPLFIEKKTAL